MNNSPQDAPKTRGLGAMAMTVSAMPRFGAGGKPSGCPGRYQAIARFPAPGGLLTWTPPPGTNSCRITDVTPGMPEAYVSRVEAVKMITQVACGERTATFAVIAASKYSFTIYVISIPPPPAAGKDLMLEVEWLPQQGGRDLV